MFSLTNYPFRKGWIFYLVFIIMQRIAESKATCKIVAVKPVACKNSRGDIAAKSALADDIHGHFPVKLTDAFTKLINGNI